MHSMYNCIPKKFLMPSEDIKKALEVIKNIGYYKQTGRPPVNPEIVIQALYYIVRTGMQWQALPGCFASSSTVHAAFQRLNDLGFFENYWLEGLEAYDKKVGLNLAKRAGDCVHIKSPLGEDAVGPSPVDRSKQGTKRSIITDGNGILLAGVVAAGNRNDAKLIDATLESIPHVYRSKGSDQLWLDAIYDTNEVRTICFRHNIRPQISPNPRKKKIEPLRYIQAGVRWVVERTHSWINRFRRLFVRYDKFSENHVAFIKLAATSHLFARLRVSG